MKKKATRKANTAVSKAANVVKSQTKEPEKVALEQRNAIAPEALHERRSTKSKMTTILGRPIVEPLVVAPAKRLTKPQLKGEPSSVSTVDLSPIANPSTQKMARTPKDNSNGRGRRSSAPTPSPSLTSTTHRPSAFTAVSVPSAKAPKAKSKSPVLSLSDIRRLPSFDIPYSERRPTVPPNTPATGLSVYEEEEESEGSRLDVGKLSDKIGNVKTTGGGLMRELPVGVKESVLTEGKAKGRGVCKKKAAVPKDIGKVAKSVGKKKLASKLKRSRKGDKKKGGSTEGEKSKARQKRVSEVEALRGMQAVGKGAGKVRKRATGKSGGKKTESVSRV